MIPQKNNKRKIDFIKDNIKYCLIFNPDNKKSRYSLQTFLNNGDVINEKLLTGVTTALNSVNKPFLMTWTVKEMAKYIKENCEKKDNIFQVSSQDVENGMKAYITKRTGATDIGTKAHDFMEDYVNTSIEKNNKAPIKLEDLNKFNLQIDDDIRHIVVRFVNSLVENFSELLESEQPVCSVKYGFAGTFDVLAKDKTGKVVMVDFKTSNQLDNLYASQVEAYKRGMREMWGKEAEYGVVIRSDKMTDDEIKEYNKTFIGKKYPKTPYEYVEYKTQDSHWMLFLCALGIHRTGIIYHDDLLDIEEFISNY